MRKKKFSAPVPPDDRDFFLEFYESHKSLLYYLARKYTTNPSDADDLIQNTLIRLMNNISTLRIISSNKSAKYVALTFKTAFIDYEKAKRKEKLLDLDDSIIENMLELHFPASDIEHNVSVRLAVAQLKEGLPARDWLVLEGKYILGLTDAEIGKLVGITTSSVRMVLHRAREKAKILLLSNDW